MKATGIVRRIDELGRVVIPKEIRRTLRIREGDPLEIYTDKDGEVILKKYSPIGEISNFAKDYTESLFRSLGHIACITDKDMIVSASGVSRKELWEKPISRDLEQAVGRADSVPIFLPGSICGTFNCRVSPTGGRILNRIWNMNCSVSQKKAENILPSTKRRGRFLWILHWIPEHSGGGISAI